MVSVWAGLLLAYAAPRVPPSFGILAVATGTYMVAVAGLRRSGRPAGAGRYPGRRPGASASE